MSIVHIPTSNTIINCLSNKYNSAAANVSGYQSRLNVAARMSGNLLLSKSKNGVPLGSPSQLQSLLQYFLRKGDETYHSMLSNANQEY